MVTAARPVARLPFEAVRTLVEAIPDPEVPVVSIADLGILREVAIGDGGRLHVVVTPTYSGCPALEAIRSRIVHEAATAGWEVHLETRLSPPWTTDWVTERGRAALRAFGIAPPQAAHAAYARVGVDVALRQVRCPRCGSADTEELARFGSTACKALRRCRSCREPFDEFKAL